MVPSPPRAWDALSPPLAEWILDAVGSMGFRRMTPVQASTIPLFMTHKDVVVEAVTGSGKTLAFLIPTIERLLRLEEPLKKHHVGAIIISPTRELATQIHSVLQSLLAFHAPSASVQNPRDEDPAEENPLATPPPPLSPTSSLKVIPQLLLGGTTTPAQDLQYFLTHSPNLLISTPGRLLDLLSSPHVHCPSSSFEVLVLDEADRLLDLGFKDDLQKILTRLPKQRRTGLFSASVSEAVDQIVRVGLRNPVKIAVKVRGVDGQAEGRTPSSLAMKYLITPASHKFPTLAKLLSTLDPTPAKTILYLSTCAAVDYFQHLLPSLLPFIPSSFSNLSAYRQKFSIVPLHGKHPPSVRHKNFTAFTNSLSPAILLTTDVAARGLDVPQVDLVVQIDPPSDPKVFLHRCGRAGRAGRKGLSIIFLQPGREEDYIRFLEVRRTPVTPLQNPLIGAISEDEAKGASERIRDAVLKDRALHDKAQRAFVSWVRSYGKHQASSIFRVVDLDWTDLGRAWGLLRLPKMPELRHWEGDRGLGLDIDFSSFAYKDRQREGARKRQMEEEEEAGGEGFTGPKKIETEMRRKGEKRAWSGKAEEKAERERRREKRKSKREQVRWAKMTPAEREEQKEAERLVELVKRRRLEEEQEQEQEFNGFDD